jgi:hypothetical protein
MTIRAIPADTSPEALRVQLDVLRALPGSRRLELAVEMSDALMEVAAVGVRQRHPEFTEEQVRQTLIRMRLGDQLFDTVYGSHGESSAG